MSHSARSRRPAAWPALAALAGVAILATALGAQETPRAGLVVQFGDGRVEAFCIDLGAGEQSGEDLLRRSGLAVEVDVTFGAQVCRIAGEGCPRDDCWCRCRTLGADCAYWSYHTLEDGRWTYSDLGASARAVRHGDVDGWAFGPGTEGQGVEPPLRTFEELCAPAATAIPASPPPSATPAPKPSARPTSTIAPARSTTRAPTGPPQSKPAGATITRAAPATVGQRATIDSGATQAGMPDADPAATRAALSATLEALFDAAIATAAAHPTAAGTAGEGLSREAGDRSERPPPTSGRDLAPARHITSANTAATVAGGRPEGTPVAGYLLFGLVAAALAGALLWLRRA